MFYLQVMEFSNFQMELITRDPFIIMSDTVKVHKLTRKSQITLFYFCGGRGEVEKMHKCNFLFSRLSHRKSQYNIILVLVSKFIIFASKK